MQCKQHMNMHISNAINQSSWACSPYLCASLVQEFWSSSIHQCCSLFVHVQVLLLPHNAFTYLCSNFSPLSLISIKDVLLIDTKDCTGVDGWYLNLAFFMDTTCMLEWHHHSPWDHSWRIFDLDTNWWGTSPYVIAWVIHLINLSSCMWGNFLHLMIT